MGKGRGNKAERRKKAALRVKSAETAVVKFWPADENDLPPLSKDGREIARGIAPLDRIEQIRRM